MDSAFIHQAANELVQNAGTHNIKQIARSCSLDISETYHRSSAQKSSNTSELVPTILPSSTHVRPMSSLGQHFSQIIF